MGGKGLSTVRQSQAPLFLKPSHALQAGLFEPPPTDENALADTLGLMLNCINSCLYMVPPLEQQEQQGRKGWLHTRQLAEHCRACQASADLGGVLLGGHPQAA